MPKVDCPSEDYEQIKLCTWMTLQGIIHYSIPNGGYRKLSEAVRLKRTGVQSGVPDLCIPISSGGFHSLYIEMKRQKGGKLSDNQIYWLALLRERHFYAEVCHGFEEAKQTVLHYLSLTPKAA